MVPAQVVVIANIHLLLKLGFYNMYKKSIITCTFKKNHFYDFHLCRQYFHYLRHYYSSPWLDRRQYHLLHQFLKKINQAQLWCTLIALIQETDGEGDIDDDQATDWSSSDEDNENIDDKDENHRND
uniref:(California timema) hypothetical protein n=1 Tax=Timema californicum TaxID=61474 RepID=A0A7R9J3F6_TIMCA|nr:unnamed protein product [Timema californicum]